MMGTKSKEVHNSLVFTGVNHLIINHDQIPLVHINLIQFYYSHFIKY